MTSQMVRRLEAYLQEVDTQENTFNLGGGVGHLEVGVGFNEVEVRLILLC